MKLVYVSHALGSGPGREANRRRAGMWLTWLSANFDAVFFAPWITLTDYWNEETGRKRGLMLDCAAVKRSDLVVLCGSVMSPGMRTETAAAEAAGVPVLELTPDVVDVAAAFAAQGIWPARKGDG